MSARVVAHEFLLREVKTSQHHVQKPISSSANRFSTFCGALFDPNSKGVIASETRSSSSEHQVLMSFVHRPHFRSVTRDHSGPHASAGVRQSDRLADLPERLLK